MLAEAIVTLRLCNEYVKAERMWNEACQNPLPLPCEKSFPIPFLLFQSEVIAGSIHVRGKTKAGQRIRTII